MSTPSLLNIPYLYKAGTLYSQIPESGAGDFTVSRTTTVANRSTRINKDGFIETVLDNVPRLDYPVGGAVNGCPALLVEPSAQNLVLRSQELDVTPTWSPVIGGTGVNPAITTNAVISPDGTQNAERIVFNRGAGNGSGDQSTLQQNITIPTTGAYILSVYAKASTAGDVGKQIFIRLGGAGALTAITLTANWVRYSRAETSVASGSQAVQIGNRGTFTADNSVSVDLWGAQAEGGAIPTSYIPTTTAAVTRSAEVIRNTTATALIGQSEGTIYFEYYHNTATNAGIRNAFNLEGNVANQFNFINFATSNNGNDLQVAVQVSGSSVVSGGIFSTSVSEGWHKVAFGYNAATNGTSFYFDGNLIATRTLTSIPAMSRIAVMARANPFSGFDLDRQFNNRIRNWEIYPNRIPNTAAPGVLSLATLTAL